LPAYGSEGPRIAAGFPFGQFGRILDVGGRDFTGWLRQLFPATAL